MDNKEKKMGTNFAAPLIGKPYPKGTKFKENPDGTISPILPKKKSAKKKTETKKK